MDKSYKAIEERISEALIAINCGHFESCRAAADAYEVRIRRLQRRHKGSKAFSERSLNSRVSNDDQEQVFIKYIDIVDKINLKNIL